MSTSRARARASARSTPTARTSSRSRHSSGRTRSSGSILIPHVAGFLKSDALLKMRGDKDRSEITVKKTVRVFRMFLVLGEGAGLHRQAPAAERHADGPQPEERQPRCRMPVSTPTIRLLQPSNDLEQSMDAFAVRLRAQGRSEHTVSAYLRDLRCSLRVLADEYPDASLRDITPAMMDAVLTDPAVTHSADGSQRSPATMHRLKASVRSFFAWAVESRSGRIQPGEVRHAQSASRARRRSS